MNKLHVIKTIIRRIVLKRISYVFVFAIFTHPFPHLSLYKRSIPAPRQRSTKI